MERTLRVWACVLAGVIALTLGGAARGADDLTTGAERLTGYYSEELKNLEEIVSLTDAQREAADSLYAEWARRSDVANKKISAFYDSMRNSRSTGSIDTSKLYNDASRKRQQHRDKLRSELNRDLQTLLSTEQMKRWPLFDRDVRRRDWLAYGSQLTGGGVDLDAAARAALGDTEPSEDLSRLLEEYKSAIDSSVRAIERRYRAWIEFNMRGTPGSWRRDQPASAEEVELVKACRGAQAVNLRFARAIFSALEEDQRKVVEDQLYEYPSYRTVTGEARQRMPRWVMQRANQAAGLDADQSAALRETGLEFAEREREIRRRLFEECVAVETDLRDEDIRPNWYPSEIDPRVEAVVKSGEELVAEFVGRAKLILTKQQLEQLGPPFVELEALELNLDDED